MVMPIKKQTKNTKMLNLKIGCIYEFTDFLGGYYKAKVIKKTVHTNSMHSYFCIWNESNSIPTGRYFWDVGAANQNRALVCDMSAIKTCKKL